MKNEITAHELALINNDLRNLKASERLTLYNATCESLGLNPLTQPFGYLEFRGGKLSLYAKKDATDQLRKIHGVSVEIVSKETIGDNFVVLAKAKDSAGRCDEDMGSVPIKGLSGEALGNAMMKAITKAKRRVTLSICGLGILDESEVETIKDVQVIQNEVTDNGGSSPVIAPVVAPPLEEPKQKPRAVTKPIDAVAPSTPSEVPTSRPRNLALAAYKISGGPLYKYPNLGKVPESEARKWIDSVTRWAEKPDVTIPPEVKEAVENIKAYWGWE